MCEDITIKLVFKWGFNQSGLIQIARISGLANLCTTAVASGYEWIGRIEKSLLLETQLGN
jgi:hypothetical protein